MMRIRQAPENKRVYLKIDSITKDVRVGIRKAYYLIGRMLKSYAAKKMTEKKSGHIYYKDVMRWSKKDRIWNKATIQHQASAPGEVPYSKAPRTTGRLRKSLAFRVQGFTRLLFSAGNESFPSPYPKYLEEGTKKMGARPYLKRSIDDNIQEAINYFHQEIDRQLKK